MHNGMARACRKIDKLVITRSNHPPSAPPVNQHSLSSSALQLPPEHLPPPPRQPLVSRCQRSWRATHGALCRYHYCWAHHPPRPLLLEVLLLVSPARPPS
mmetsp:Transcript_4711/g.12606  ORF Transcript_4711/g.12606 Transcript_4711/m.12606 type:complete len:100 (+) Transcript_4711:276-575(+)